MRERLKAAAEKNNRSMNAEIVSRLELTFERKAYEALSARFHEIWDKTYSGLPPEAPPMKGPPDDGTPAAVTEFIDDMVLDAIAQTVREAVSEAMEPYKRAPPTSAGRAIKVE